MSETGTVSEWLLRQQCKGLCNWSVWWTKAICPKALAVAAAAAAVAAVQHVAVRAQLPAASPGMHQGNAVRLQCRSTASEGPDGRSRLEARRRWHSTGTAAACRRNRIWLLLLALLRAAGEQVYSRQGIVHRAFGCINIHAQVALRQLHARRSGWSKMFSGAIVTQILEPAHCERSILALASCASVSGGSSWPSGVVSTASSCAWPQRKQARAGEGRTLPAACNELRPLERRTYLLLLLAPLRWWLIHARGGHNGCGFTSACMRQVVVVPAAAALRRDSLYSLHCHRRVDGLAVPRCSGVLVYTPELEIHKGVRRQQRTCACRSGQRGTEGPSCSRTNCVSYDPG